MFANLKCKLTGIVGLLGAATLSAACSSTSTVHLENPGTPPLRPRLGPDPGAVAPTAPASVASPPFKVVVRSRHIFQY